MIIVLRNTILDVLKILLFWALVLKFSFLCLLIFLLSERRKELLFFFFFFFFFWESIEQTFSIKESGTIQCMAATQEWGKS